MTFLSILLDVALIGLLIAGIHYAMKLTRQLAEMRNSRTDMERFVLEFNATVARAEAGIRGLKNTARSCGDDLEKLIEKGQLLRDELQFLTESADQMANRISDKASMISRAPDSAASQPKPQQPAQAKPAPAAAPVRTAAEQTQAALEELRQIASGSVKTSSAAERDLLRALGKLG